MSKNKIFQAVDKLVNLDISARGVIDILYRHAREKTKKPMAQAAAEKIEQTVTAGEPVIIATGAALPWGESDGPPGAAVLARTMKLAFNAVPVVLVDSTLIEATNCVIQAAGLRRVDFERAKRGGSFFAMKDFPEDDKPAKIAAEKIIREINPSVVVTVERNGMNEKGIYHSSKGVDVTKGRAKLDYLINEAMAQGILTIGVGDGGNEIGMGNIRNAIREHIPYGIKCRCPCGSGVAPVTQTNILVTATVSNWGAYGIAASLSALLDRLELLHTGSLEARILEKSADGGFIDGVTGRVEPTVDGLSKEDHIHFVNLLGTIVRSGLAGPLLKWYK